MYLIVDFNLQRYKITLFIKTRAILEHFIILNNTTASQRFFEEKKPDHSASAQ